MIQRILIVALLLVAAAVAEVEAIDHKNLEAGRPLRLEDAYPISTGEIAIETGGGLTLQRRRPDRGFFPIQILYGALPNLQLEVGSTLSTEPRSIEEQTKSGDLRLGALYNFNQETMRMPAFAAKLGEPADGRRFPRRRLSPEPGP